MDKFEPRWAPRLETDAEFLERFKQAERAGEDLASTEPCAKAIVFQAENRTFTLTLTGGTTIGFAADAVPELENASDSALASAEIIPSGTGVSWRALDVDVSVSGLVLALLGGSEWRRSIRQAANRQAAQTKSEARTKASRNNGRKGGRPRKAAQG